MAQPGTAGPLPSVPLMWYGIRIGAVKLRLPPKSEPLKIEAKVTGATTYCRRFDCRWQTARR